VRIPEPLLTCAGDPEIPDPLNDANLADYLLSLWTRGDDCAGKLDQVKELAR